MACSGVGVSLGIRVGIGGVIGVGDGIVRLLPSAKRTARTVEVFMVKRFHYELFVQLRMSQWEVGGYGRDFSSEGLTHLSPTLVLCILWACASSS